MAKVIGNSAGGYATVNPVQDTIGPAMRNLSEDYTKMEALKQKQAQQKAEQEQKRLEFERKKTEQDIATFEKTDAVKIKDSGFRGITSAVYNAAMGEKEKYRSNIDLYRKTQDRQYLDKASAAMQNLQRVAQIPESYKSIVDKTTEGYIGGTISRSEKNRIAKIGDQIEKGYIVPKIENGVMTYDIYEDDPVTNTLSKAVFKNITSEELQNQLTPSKKFDYNADLKKTIDLAGPSVKKINPNGTETIGVPNSDKYAAAKAKLIYSNPALLDDIAEHFGVEPDPKTNQYAPEDIQKVYDSYLADLKAGFSTVTNPNYDAENQRMKREDQQRQNEAHQMAKNKVVKEDGKPFTAPVALISKSGTYYPLGAKVQAGDKILSPTYEKGKEGPIKGVILNKDGAYTFSIANRKSSDLNAQGLKNKALFEENPANAGKDYEPIDSDYVYSTNKPTLFSSTNDIATINTYVQGMINPDTGTYYKNFTEYKKAYNQHIPKNRSISTQSAPKNQSAPKSNKNIDVKGKKDKNL
jgi:hypothetical protein